MDIKMKNTEVKIVTRSSYGHKRNYPANTLAEMFCLLCRSKCLSDDDLKVIRALGFSVSYSRGNDESDTHL